MSIKFKFLGDGFGDIRLDKLFGKNAVFRGTKHGHGEDKSE